MGGISDQGLMKYGKPVRTHTNRINGTNFKTGRIESANLILELLRSSKGVVTKIDIAWEGERKFSVGEKSRWGMLMI